MTVVRLLLGLLNMVFVTLHQRKNLYSFILFYPFWHCDELSPCRKKVVGSIPTHGPF